MGRCREQFLKNQIMFSGLLKLVVSYGKNVMASHGMLFEIKGFVLSQEGLKTSFFSKIHPKNFFCLNMYRIILNDKPNCQIYQGF
jgi:hypothetical protein